MGSNFTVVANEVKLLAEESASHANKIREAIVRLNSAADDMSERTNHLRSQLQMACEHGSDTREYISEIATIIEGESNNTELTSTEAMEQKKSMAVIDQHMDTLSKGVKSSVEGSAANMELVANALRLSLIHI